MLAAGTGGLDKRGTVLAGEENFEELIPRVLLIIVNAVCTCQEEFGKEKFSPGKAFSGRALDRNLSSWYN